MLQSFLMKSVTVEHGRLIFDRAYRAKMRPIITRARNIRGRSSGTRIVVIHDERCCAVQPYAETERAVWTAAGETPTW
jgi:hypothetical protein